ncbi:MAG: hypothetical protein J5705_02555 [Bacteroidaceae bacterium]|nr:hypothetical protein [Bacteroidaceae bacterium]
MRKNITVLLSLLLCVSCEFGGIEVQDETQENNEEQETKIPDGAINALFSVNSKGDSVYFSQGNLQYQPSTKTMRFAENQWDYVGHNYKVGIDFYEFETVHMGTVTGSSNEGITNPAYTGWIDLFGWATSGYDGRRPDMSVLDPLEYLTDGKDIAGTDYDWGVYNPISNGGGKAGMWRTLTRSEWEYIIHERSTTSGMLFAAGTVNGVHGLLLFPDSWNASVYTINGANETYDVCWTTNDISLTDWTGKLEPAGVIFLPCAGNRGNVNYPDEESNGGGTGPEGNLPFEGNYYSSSVGGYSADDAFRNSAYILFFAFQSSTGYRGTVRADYGQYSCLGCSVRLVADK